MHGKESWRGDAVGSSQNLLTIGAEQMRERRRMIDSQSRDEQTKTEDQELVLEDKSNKDKWTNMNGHLNMISIEPLSTSGSPQIEFRFSGWNWR